MAPGIPNGGHRRPLASTVSLDFWGLFTTQQLLNHPTPCLLCDLLTGIASSGREASLALYLCWIGPSWSVLFCLRLWARPQGAPWLVSPPRVVSEGPCNWRRVLAALQPYFNSTQLNNYLEHRSYLSAHRPTTQWMYLLANVRDAFPISPEAAKARCAQALVAGEQQNIDGGSWLI